MKEPKENAKKTTHKLSDTDEKQYVNEKIREALPQLRILFICFTLLYGAFGYLDFLTAHVYSLQFFIIRYVIVIPLFIVFLALSYRQIIFTISQWLLTFCLVVGGMGIAYMLIVYPSNFSYYGGLFMVIFSGYFLLKLNSSYAVIGNLIIFHFYIFGSLIVHGRLNFDTILVTSFFAGANVIGALGNYQLERMGRLRFMQEKEIKNQNKQLEALVLSQRNELLQIEKAFESTSDAIAIFSPVGKLTNFNDAFSKIMEIDEDTGLGLYHQLDDIILEVLHGSVWNGERIINSIPDDKKILLIQADSVFESGEVIGAVVTCKDITKRKNAEVQTQYISFHDHLTGLYNRYWYEEEIRNFEFRQQVPLSIIMADLNGLKLLNDTFGHAVGDRFLMYAAEVFKQVCRAEDLVVRWGGDEFVILMPRTTYDEATKIAEEITSSSARFLCEGVPVSMAIGVACKVSHNEEIDNILKLAEEKMYRQKLTEGRSAKIAILNALNKTMQVKSSEPESHTKNMQEIAKKMGLHMGLSEDDLARLELVVKLHDIGKINIPAEILKKENALSLEEWEIIKKHSEIGYRIAQATEDFSHVAHEILSHHERWDGKGYPQNLKGESIPFLSRITTIADAYEVMLNGSPYKAPMSKEETIKEIKRCSGTQFDPEIVTVFLQVVSGS
ncbi:diguanylate cyclase [Fusibacter bizertensis]|uniref:Diguanylate cyclase n=1 Tax=Fusibacter bizertensis TaxID=1488331 RepID=A0ABT6NEB2_9FIRM|nr:diguanylate cyclase [Fusibacter bizertensis]MDH8678764.1 diguanylate cyclase [Fusibacter bizertensis]